jgi:phage terminase large subunit-like protein
VIVVNRNEPEELTHLKRFAGHMILDTTRPAVIEEFQAVMLTPFYSGVTETVILIPKKNGKTTTLAIVALHHLCFTEDAEVVIAASSRDQATILLDQAAKIVRRSRVLDDRVVVKRGFREIRSLRDSGRIRVLAADADTADGVIPTLALVDELHRHKSAELYGVFRDGLGPRDGRMVTISTAGEDEDTPLGELRARALLLPHVEVEGRRTLAYDDKGAFALLEWALREDDDVHDIAVVKQANPASWQTHARLQERHDSPSTKPWQWARFACGLWVRGQESAISPEDWSRCLDKEAVIPDGSPAWLGLDLAWTIDCTAIVPLWMEGPRRRVVGRPVILRPPGDGSMIDERAIVWALLIYAGEWAWSRRDFVQALSGSNRADVVEDWANAIERAAHPLRVQGIVYDPNAGGRQMVQQLQREHDLPFIEHSQDNAPMALASTRLADAIPSLIRHDGDAGLRNHVLTAVQKWLGGEKWKYDRPTRGKRRPIDALTALEFAHSVAVAELEEPPAERPRVEVLV